MNSGGKKQMILNYIESLLSIMVLIGILCILKKYFGGLMVMTLTKKEKEIKAMAQQDWNEQCKKFMMYKIPFKDKTFKECYKRYMEKYGNE